MRMVYVIPAIIIAVLAVFFLFGKAALVRAETKEDFPPKPKWRPSLPVDLDRIEKTANYYSNGKKTFAIFKNGTVVFVEPSADAELQAKAQLNKIFIAHPDFNPQAMDDGNYAVTYSQPAYTIIFQDEFEKNRAYIDANHQDGLCRAEVLLDGEGRPNNFDDRGKIGLFGRARMFMDAESPEVVRIHKGNGDNPIAGPDAIK